MSKFEKSSLHHNEIMPGDGFFVSFVADTSATIGGAMFAGDTAAETALVVPADIEAKYRILNGDHRRGYEEAVKGGLKGCLAYYDKHKTALKSSWSSDQ